MTNWNAAFNPLADMVREARTREEKSKELADMDHDDAEQAPDDDEEPEFSVRPDETAGEAIARWAEGDF